MKKEKKMLSCTQIHIYASLLILILKAEKGKILQIEQKIIHSKIFMSLILWERKSYNQISL